MNVAAYAQSSDRQGVDAALDGVVVDSESEPFAALRKRAIALNLEVRPTRVDDVEVRYGKGIVRLQFDGDDLEGHAASPIVVVILESAIDQDRDLTIRSASESVVAIGRQASRESLNQGLSEAVRIRDAHRQRQLIGIALIVGAAASIAVWAAWPRS